MTNFKWKLRKVRVYMCFIYKRQNGTIIFYVSVSRFYTLLRWIVFPIATGADDGYACGRCSYLPTWRRPVAWRSISRDLWSTTQSAGCATIELSGVPAGRVTPPSCRCRSVTDCAPVQENDSPNRDSTRQSYRSATFDFNFMLIWL